METQGSAAQSETQQWPSRKPPALVVLVGPPGTGKSYLARRIAERVPVRIVETDEIRRQLTPRPTYSREESRKVYHAAHRKIDRLLRLGKDVVFDATNIYERGRRTLYRIAESDGARLLIVETVAPDDVVAERLQRRKESPRPEDRSEAGWDVYARMKAEFEEIERPHMEVDTSQPLEPAIDAIVQFIRNQR